MFGAIGLFLHPFPGTAPGPSIDVRTTRPTATVSVSGPAARVTYEFGERALPVLHALADEVSAQLISVR